MTDRIVTPDYASIEPVRNICEVWINAWSGDEWGESMHALHQACHTDYGFSHEDCALFANRLLANLREQKEWMDDEGRSYELTSDELERELQTRCRELRDYWLKGGNLTGSEHAIKAATETIEKLPDWLFGESGNQG